MVTFNEMDRTSRMDIRARMALSRWQDLRAKGSQVQAEPRQLESFQPESEYPEEVGMHETIADEFDPEELVSMFDRPPLVVDWDALDVS